MSFAYRSAYQQIVGTRLAEAKEAKEHLEPLLPRLRSIHAARVARIGAGAVGILGALGMAAVAVFDKQGETAIALILAGAMTVVMYLLTRGIQVLPRLFVRPPGWTLPALTGDLDADLARIDASNPVEPMTRKLERLEVFSTALPLAAISLLAPLTLHLIVLAVFGSISMKEFSGWMQVSLVVVGHAHLALMAAAIAFARKMKRMPSGELAHMRITREWAKALGIAVGVAAAPGVVLLAVPPVLTAITGLAFIPFMYVLMRRSILSERQVIETAEYVKRVRVADAAEASTAMEEAIWAEPDAHEERVLAARL